MDLAAARYKTPNWNLSFSDQITKYGDTAQSQLTSDMSPVASLTDKTE